MSASAASLSADSGGESTDGAADGDTLHDALFALEEAQDALQCSLSATAAERDEAQWQLQELTFRHDQLKAALGSGLALGAPAEGLPDASGGAVLHLAVSLLAPHAAEAERALEAARSPSRADDQTQHATRLAEAADALSALVSVLQMNAHYRFVPTTLHHAFIGIGCVVAKGLRTAVFAARPRKTYCLALKPLLV